VFSGESPGQELSSVGVLGVDVDGAGAELLDALDGGCHGFVLL
jgi:hypothetical protein